MIWLRKGNDMTMCVSISLLLQIVFFNFFIAYFIGKELSVYIFTILTLLLPLPCYFFITFSKLNWHKASGVLWH